MQFSQIAESEIQVAVSSVGADQQAHTPTGLSSEEWCVLPHHALAVQDSFYRLKLVAAVSSVVSSKLDGPQACPEECYVEPHSVLVVQFTV